MKKLLKVLLPVVILVGLLVFAQKVVPGLISKDPQTQIKEDELEVVVDFKVVVDGEEIVIDSVRVVAKQTDITTLGDVLDTLIDTNDNLDIILEGNKTDPFGRFLAGVNEYVTPDMNTGPWWGIYSETNQDCLDAGFCTGIDSQSIYANDVFELRFE